MCVYRYVVFGLPQSDLRRSVIRCDAFQSITVSPSQTLSTSVSTSRKVLCLTEGSVITRTALRRDDDLAEDAGGAPKMCRVEAIDVDDPMGALGEVGSEDEWEPVFEVAEDDTVINHVPWDGWHAGS